MEAKKVHTAHAIAIQSIPTWYKRHDGVMLSLSPSYEKLFLESRGYTGKYYIGKKDSAVWPHDIAIEFRKNDLRVWQTGMPEDVTETVEIWKGCRVTMRIIKIRYKDGILGCAIPAGMENTPEAIAFMNAADLARARGEIKQLDRKVRRMFDKMARDN